MFGELRVRDATIEINHRFWLSKKSKDRMSAMTPNITHQAHKGINWYIQTKEEENNDSDLNIPVHINNNKYQNFSKESCFKVT